MTRHGVTLLSTDEEVLTWCAERGITMHKFTGGMDDDCTTCGLSIYMACHTDAMPRLDTPCQSSSEPTTKPPSTS